MTKHRKIHLHAKDLQTRFCVRPVCQIDRARVFAGDRGMLWRSWQRTFRFCTKRQPCKLCCPNADRLRGLGRPGDCQ